MPDFDITAEVRLVVKNVRSQRDAESKAILYICSGNASGGQVEVQGHDLVCVTEREGTS